MTRRQKILIVVAIIFVLAALAMLLLQSAQQPETVNAPVTNEPSLNRPLGGLGGSQNVSTNSTNSSVQPTDNVPTDNSQPPVGTPTKPDERSNVSRVAMAFAERFGSFSNSSDFSNIVDLEPLMTDAMVAWADKYVADQRANVAPSAEYYGTTTRSLSSSISVFDDLRGFATVKVLTQRHEQKATETLATTYYQEITLEMRKKGDIWKVESATWGNRQ